MSQIKYRGNLSTKSFPLISKFQGRTVIVPGPDSTSDRRVISSEDDDRDAGIPQVYYCHNMMPSAQGMQSIAYNQITNPISPAEAVAADDIFLLRDSDNNKVDLTHFPNGENWVVKPDSPNTWVKINTVGGAGSVTTAYVSGVTYVYFSNVGCYKYNFGTDQLDAVALTGLTAADVVVITTAAGYLVAVSKDAVAWSSTIDPTDFTPSLLTGAGGGSVEEAKGALTVAVDTPLGFIIYTTSNAVSATYSGNARFPFNFREITGAGGCSSSKLVTRDSKDGGHYSYTTKGLQRVTHISGDLIFPEITNFIAGSHFEDFDESLLLFTYYHLTQTMVKQISIASGRYVIISYGRTSLTHAIVLDIAMKRWGKLKFPHVRAFEFELLDPEVKETPRNSIALVQADGRIYTLDFSVDSVEGIGVLLLGKYQYVRPRWLDIECVELEEIKLTDTFKCYLIPSLDGKTPAYTKELPVQTMVEGLRTYAAHDSGMNHSILLIGGFYLSSIQLTFVARGRY